MIVIYEVVHSVAVVVAHGVVSAVDVVGVVHSGVVVVVHGVGVVRVQSSVLVEHVVVHAVVVEHGSDPHPVSTQI